MKTIVILCDFFLPAYKAGGPVQSIANLIEHSQSLNVSYKVLCSNLDLDKSVLNVEPDKWIKYNSYTDVYYISKKHLSAQLITHHIKTIKPDILFINGIYSWHFNLIPLLLSKTPRKIVSACGMLHQGALSQKKIKKKIYLSLWKLIGLNRNCDFHASDEEEKKQIENVFGTSINIFIAHNFPKIINRQQPEIEKKRGILCLVSVALISPMKNHLLVLKALMNCAGNVSYNIYGPVKNKLYWNNCLQQIKKIPPNINVNYCGDIPPNQVAGILAKNHVFILPSISENFGHAIFEALSAGNPVITSHKTPWNNLKPAKAGINVTPENTEELTNGINYFTSMDNDEFELWKTGANKYSISAIDINDIKNQFKKMFLL